MQCVCYFGELQPDISTRLCSLDYILNSVYNEIKNKILPPYVKLLCHNEGISLVKVA